MHTIEAVWGELQEGGRKQAMWYSGSVKRLEDFMAHLMLMPTWFLWDTVLEEWCFMFSIEPLATGWAWTHFCGLTTYRRSQGETGMKVLSEQGLKGLLGMTPENNKNAIRLLKTLGWKVGGTVPGYCEDYYKGTTFTGVISHYRLET